MKTPRQATPIADKTAQTTAGTVKLTATVECRDEDSYSVSWTIGSDRYHFWTDKTGKVRPKMGHSDTPTLYKNSVAGYREEGHYACRYLNANAGGNRKMIEAALAQVDLTKAKMAYQAKQATETAERLAAHKAIEDRKRIEAAAPELLEALEGVLYDVSDCEGNPSTNAGDANQGACMECFNCKALIRVRAAITKATLA